MCIQIHSKKYENVGINYNSRVTKVTGSVLIDTSVGRDTTFTFTWNSKSNGYPPYMDIYLNDPDNVRYCSKYGQPTDADCQPRKLDVIRDPASKTITISFSGMLKVMLIVMMK